MSELAKVETKLLFFNLWFKKIPDNSAERLISQAGDVKYYLQHLRALRKYTLSVPEEKIIVLKDVTGCNALNSIFDVLTAKFQFSVGGKILEEEQVTSLFRDQSRDIRKEAYTALLSKYKENHEVIGTW